MKRAVYAADWDHNSEDDSVNALKELMHENISRQDDPEVGIFWYDTEDESLFGVKSADVNDIDFYKSNLFNGQEVKTCRPAHKTIWEREFSRGKDKRFQGDYALVPRGRIFYVKDEGFVVIVGDWIDDYPEAKDEILYEFNLPEDTEFKKVSTFNGN